MTTHAFTFDFDDRYRRVDRLFGISPDSALVTVADGRLTARFGPWVLATELSNIAGAEIAGPYSLLKTIGPARLSLSDRGLTFATNSRRGVCVEFVRPVPGIDPLGKIKHPNLTVTVRDCAGLLTALTVGGLGSAAG
ncbi:MAG: hypothetical protein ABWZ02_08520 [Nakamurella sp.]